MSKFVFITIKEPAVKSRCENALLRVLENISPLKDQIKSHVEVCFPHILGVLGGDYSTTSNSGLSIFENFLQVQPDSSYEIHLTHDEVKVSVNHLGNETIWYVVTSDHMIISNSQRAIVSLLGSFEFNTNVLPWFLSSGTIGVGNSYDKRVKQLLASQYLTYNIVTQETKLTESFVPFQPGKESNEYFKKELKRLLSTVLLSKYFTKDANIVLPISGGYDSRCLLFYMQLMNVSCVSWGKSTESNRQSGDIFIASQLCEFYKKKHSVFFTDFSKNLFEDTIDNFVKNSEGRIDHVQAYLDNFDTWNHLSKSVSSVVVRGDEVFGWLPVYTAFDARRSVGLTLMSDFHNLPRFISSELPMQNLPDFLIKEPNETLEAYRDRLYQSFRIPVVIASLNNIISSFVKVKSPYLDNSISNFMKTVPDNLRTNKFLFSSIVNEYSPSFPFATKDSLESLESILHYEYVNAYLLKELRGVSESHIISPTVIKYVIDQLNNKVYKVQNGETSNLKTFGRLIPKKIKSNLRNSVFMPTLSVSYLAFRIVLISKAIEMFKNDSKIVVYE